MFGQMQVNSTRKRSPQSDLGYNQYGGSGEHEMAAPWPDFTTLGAAWALNFW